MIKVEMVGNWQQEEMIAKEPYGITVTGHAGAGKPGEDIVCAAVSILLNVLAELLADENSADLQVRMEPGDAEILHRGISYEGSMAYNYFGTGINKLCEEYPQYIQASWREEPHE